MGGSRQKKSQKKSEPSSGLVRLRVPSEDEVVTACTEAKKEHPEYGVKRVFLHVVGKKTEWQLTMRRVQRVMRSRRLTASPDFSAKMKGPASELPEVDMPLCFPEDCVSLQRRPTQIGWVLSAAGVLGGEDDDDDSDEEDEDRSPELKPGTARIQWLDSYEPTVESTQDVRVLDRPLVAGDIVASKDHPTGPLGTVTKIEVKADLRIIHLPAVATPPSTHEKQHESQQRRFPNRPETQSANGIKCTHQSETRPHIRHHSPRGERHASSTRNRTLKIKSIIRGLETTQLTPAGKVRNGDAVGHAREKRWVGRVMDATYDLTVKACGFAQGQTCILRAVDDHSDDYGRAIEPREDADYGFDELCPYFPGQRLSAPPFVWRKAHWENKSSGRAGPSALGLRGNGRKHGIVEKVELNQLYVDWLAFGPGASRTPPPAWVSATDVVFMPIFASALRVGDHLTVSTADLRAAAQRASSPPLSPLSPQEDADCCVQVLQTHTTCHVKWGESTEASEVVVSSLELVPRQQLGDHDFLPHDFVTPIKEDDEHVDEGKERVGVVKTVDSKQRTVIIQWKGHEECEKYSVYELALHPRLNLNAGELVLRLLPGAGLTAGRVATRTEDGKIELLEVPEDVPFAEARDIATAIRLSLESTSISQNDPDVSKLDGCWLGQVTALDDGSVHVVWLDGSRTLEAPTDLIPVPDARSESDEDEEVDEDDDDKTTSTLDEYEKASTNFFPASLESLGSAPSPASEEEEPKESWTCLDEKDDDDDGGAEAFAVVETLPPSDHYFEEAAPAQLPLTVVHKIWSQLRRSLPTGIAVRAFQNRSDLLRALIIGPEDTPYDQLLYVFDLQLPANYPAEPPGVHYHACGVKERLNPNLYACGKVCLSLLGTWSGPGWDPANSTVLQLLVSIQGLVLSPQPYYNEPGHEKHQGTVEGEHQSHHYNEAATLLSIKTSIALLKHPPRPLASVIAHHLRSGSFAKFMDRLYSQLNSASSTQGTSSSIASEGFLCVLGRLLPQLRTAVDRFLRLHPEPNATIAS